jgi:hypothetical protein
MNKLPPSKRNKEIEKITFPPMHISVSTVSTMVNKDYLWYAPLFIESVLRSYPIEWYHPNVLYHTEDPRNNLPEKYQKYIVPIMGTGIKPTGLNTATLRLLHADHLISSNGRTVYDWALITDCDMLIRKEYPPIHIQHLRAMMKNWGKTCCYNGYLVSKNPPRAPGVIFVNSRWFVETQDAREVVYKKLKTIGSHEWGDDEYCLGDVLVNSNLPITTNPMLWTNHGIHLGAIRRNSHSTITAQDQLQVIDLCSDKEYMNLVDQCAEHIPVIGTVFTRLKELANVD